MKHPFGVRSGDSSPFGNAPLGWDDEEEDHPGGGSSEDDDDDDDNDDDSISGNRRRRSSFGDAEDHMLLQRSTPSGLHHRRALPRTTAQMGAAITTASGTASSTLNGTGTGIPTTTSILINGNTNSGLYETPTPKRKATVTSSSLPFFATGGGGGASGGVGTGGGGFHYGPKHRSWWIRWAVLATMALYALVLVQTTRWSGDSGNIHASIESVPSATVRLHPPPLSPSSSSSSSALQWMQDWSLTGRITNNSPLPPQQQQQQQLQQQQRQQQQHQQQQRQLWSTDMMRQLKEQTRQVTVERATRRKTRTRPVAAATTTTTADGKVPWYTVDAMRRSSRDPLDDAAAAGPEDPPDSLLRPPSPPPLASLDQLCGIVAQNASRSDAHHHYPSTAALSKESRVFITGLLSPLGMRLALKLHMDCGVELIGGVDLMYPNTVAHRLGLVQERLALLTTHIPTLHKPVGLSFMGILPQTKNQDNDNDNDDNNKHTEEFDMFTDLQPTHVIHLASYNDDNIPSPEQRRLHPYSPYSTPDGPPLSPYTNATWFARQSAWWGMEQVLQGMQELPVMPQFVYVTTKATTTNSHPFPFAKHTTQAIEEVLVRTYQRPALSIYLPQLYGEWDLAGSLVHDTIEHLTVHGPQDPPQGPLSSASSPTLSLLHLDDAVEALVAALQYQPSVSDTSPHQSLLDLSTAASPELSTHHLVSFLGTHHRWNMNTTGITDTTTTEMEAAAIIREDENLSLRAQHSHPALVGWQPRISLHHGLIRTMAWHLHRHSPYGTGTSTTSMGGSHHSEKRAVVEPADDFLKRHGLSTCPAHDWQCHKSFQSHVPCLSECNTRHQCLPSIFDGMEGLTRNVTEGCQIVLYTQALGYNVKDLALQSEYMEDADLHENDKLVCNFAFIPRDSTLVKIVTAKVPDEQLNKFGITPQEGKDMHDLKLDGLNGRLLYRGWILLWVKDATTHLSPTDQSLLKLSPSKFFHSDVERAVFMEENSSVSPRLADVFFLVDQLKRHALPKRTVNKDVRIETSFGKESVKRQKFRLPPEPHRRAAILFAPLRIPNDPHDSNIQRIRRGDKKLKVRDAVKFMRHEFELEGKETASESRQREFYEKIPSYLNRNDMRSSQEPWYQYAMRHWVRTRWVVHDVQLEESRLLRCDWYQEHLSWGNELDQLSFAHVMAVRELKRRIAHQEPDDHFKTFIEQHPQLKDMTDSYEWHPMETDTNLLYREPVQWNSLLPDHVAMDAEDEPPPPPLDPKDPVPLFVRIVSEHVLAGSRRLWAKERKKKDKTKKAQA